MGVSKVLELVGACCIYTTCVNSTEKGLIFRQWLEESDEYDSPNDPGPFSVGSGYDLHSQISEQCMQQPMCIILIL